MRRGGFSYPTADAIARAIWAAAKVFDERYLLRTAPRRVMMGGVNPTMTSSWYVLAALEGAYPHVPIASLARWVGIRLGPNVAIMPHLMARRRSANWRASVEVQLRELVAA